MTVVRNTLGLIFRDQFTRADSNSLGNGWTDWELIATDIQIKTNQVFGAAANRNTGGFRPASEAPTNAIVQINAKANATNVFVVRLSADGTPNQEAYQFLGHIAAGQWQLIRRQSGGNSTLCTSSTSPPVVGNWYGIRGRREGANVEVLSTGILTNGQDLSKDFVSRCSATDGSPLSSFDKSGFQRGANIVAAGDFDEFAVFGLYITVDGLPTGHKVQVDSRTPVVESGGSVQIDIKTWSLPATTLKILNPDDVEIDSITPAEGVWGGDDYSFAGIPNVYTTTVADAIAENVGVFFCRGPAVTIYTPPPEDFIPPGVGIKKVVNGLDFRDQFERGVGSVGNNWIEDFDDGSVTIAHEDQNVLLNNFVTYALISAGFMRLHRPEDLGTSLGDQIFQMTTRGEEFGAGLIGMAQLTMRRVPDVSSYQFGYIVPFSGTRRYTLGRNVTEVASNSTDEQGTSQQKRVIRTVFIAESNGSLTIDCYAKLLSGTLPLLNQPSQPMTKVISYNDINPNVGEGFSIFYKFGNSYADEVSVCGRGVQMINLPAGWKIRLDGGTPVAESGGIARIEVDGLALPGTTVDLLNPSEALIASVSPADLVWGGDVYEPTFASNFTGCLGVPAGASWSKSVF